MSSSGAPDGLGAQLTRLGLGETAARIYGRMLESAPVTAGELARRYGDTETVQTALKELADAGLALPSGVDGTEFRPANPGEALAALTTRRQAELHDARLAVQTAYRAFRRAHADLPHAQDLLEVVTGDAIVPRLRHLATMVRHQVRRLDSPPYFTGGHRNLLEEEQLRRGIIHRCVYSGASLGDPGYLAENILPCLRAGEKARLLPELPVKLTLFDDRAATIALTIRETDRNRSIVIVRPCSLFSALEGLFETSWAAALPLDREARTADQPIRPIERELLLLLAAGRKDDEIAAGLGVSRRTLFRYLETLMDRAGVSSRFQLGVFAAHNGWL
ncbi:helix-turn-helix transcriptional regulator [Amycolatopsis orientalis]|uniref:Helix-turn-helix transcriptional regulator n=1 Tax=Amycolatopsis orientalis TaxID=31958 RepID=A0A193BYM7_AMYOR|nr:LuxR C-terminal-related transcriptional regulator [Amycolatopsis orientalis]ANN17274.1 helix-turn-helix transcriptional regulator [Amycolatopsis orientalis]